MVDINTYFHNDQVVDTAVILCTVLLFCERFLFNLREGNKIYIVYQLLLICGNYHCYNFISNVILIYRNNFQVIGSYRKNTLALLFIGHSTRDRIQVQLRNINVRTSG
jgi:hypothetical protein